MNYSKWKAVPETTDGDNFATSIYVDDYKGLLVARCDQNGERPWLSELIVNAPRLRAENDQLKQELDAALRREAALREALQLCYDESRLWAGESSDMGLTAESRTLRLIHSASESALAPDADPITAAADAAGDRLSQMSERERSELKDFALGLSHGKTFTREQLLPVVEALQTCNRATDDAAVLTMTITDALAHLSALGLQ